MALTLRSLGGLSTAEVARALLAGEGATAQRIVRAKRKIAANKIPYEVPVAGQMPERLPAVLATLYLIFNEGYLASSSEALVRTELNRAVAVAMSEGPEQGLELIDAIDGLDDYLTLHTARADLLRRLERPREAAGAYRRALELEPNPGERRLAEG